MMPADEPPARTVLQAQLLGGCALRFAGRPIPETAFARKRALLVLLSLLLARGHALPREVLVDRLWPKGDLESGVAGLHNALSSLGAALGGGPTARLAVVSRGEIVALSPSL